MLLTNAFIRCKLGYVQMVNPVLFLANENQRILLILLIFHGNTMFIAENGPIEFGTGLTSASGSLTRPLLEFLLQSPLTPVAQLITFFVLPMGIVLLLEELLSLTS